MLLTLLDAKGLRACPTHAPSAPPTPRPLCTSPCLSSLLHLIWQAEGGEHCVQAVDTFLVWDILSVPASLTPTSPVVFILSFFFLFLPSFL